MVSSIGLRLPPCGSPYRPRRMGQISADPRGASNRERVTGGECVLWGGLLLFLEAKGTPTAPGLALGVCGDWRDGCADPLDRWTASSLHVLQRECRGRDMNTREGGGEGGEDKAGNKEGEKRREGGAKVGEGRVSEGAKKHRKKLARGC
uniref:Uncharacterized protein n=1 Tax=Chromera velia CCMP2878 TaxID=1169474 RepID=A0A0G4F2Y0_9ALVE|eukprot:Cvel_2699.t1-p1 / transcript=Cvel_2699.t1 / gene=Cvel_2699 / organism=Chromera_velia_CCMP2878 / gene_product=hypothetical protein / transcript_product=hypothetical protein / location=Cvel_scaffold108:35780-36223(-) / protein_length=148 / sequence_SO=supercontig / SO=protein_coding / is_pseudo=false